MDPADAGMKFSFLLLAWLAASLLLPAQTPPPQPVAFRIGSVRFDRPDGWNYSRPADGVRAAQLEKKTGGVPLLITFTRFPPGSGGSVQANVDRWIAQFLATETPAEILKPKGTALPLTTVKLAGTMRGGVPGGPTKDTPASLLLGAILESPDGLVIAKLAGPRAAVGREEKVFSDLVRAAAGRAP
jgi:hypothetical protein